jgi:hypothetical protein
MLLLQWRVLTTLTAMGAAVGRLPAVPTTPLAGGGDHHTPVPSSCTTLRVDISSSSSSSFGRGCSGVLHSINASAPPSGVLAPLRLGMYRGPAPWWGYSHLPCNASTCVGPFDARYQRIAALGARQQFILDGPLEAVCYYEDLRNVSGGRLAGCSYPGFGTDRSFRRWDQVVRGIVNEAVRRGDTSLEFDIFK